MARRQWKPIIGSNTSEGRLAVYVKDVMTTKVVTVSPETSLRDVAATFLAHGISGAPVCDADGRVLGVISKTDIVKKERGPIYTQPSGLLTRLKIVKEPAKVDARTAGEAMTQPAITVYSFMSVSAAAQLMLEHGVHRLPVVSQDTISGIVTETDLVRAFTRPDEEIRAEIADELRWQLVDLPARSRGCPNVEVRDGTVVVTGEIERRSDLEIVDHVIRRVPGVESITVNLTWLVDDLHDRAAVRI
jgi:CBS domain-containing protein